MGYAPDWFGVDGMDGILTLDGFDTSLAEGVMLLTPFNADSSDERTQAFVQKYQEQYGEIPNQFAADAYDCVYAYKQALEAAGATPDMSAADPLRPDDPAVHLHDLRRSDRYRHDLGHQRPRVQGS